VTGSFFTTWRLRNYPRWFLVPLFLPVIITVATAEGATTISGQLGGDFPPFYAAGSIVNEGDIMDVYDVARHAKAQEDIKSPNVKTFRFAYPPFVAHAYSLLAKLPYREAYAVHTASMFAYLALSVALLARLLPIVRRWALEAFVCAGAFYPLYRGITGGQNSAFTVLVVVLVYWALAEDRPVVAGAAAGLLLYKPQLAVPVVGVLILRNWRSGIGFGCSAAVIWLWGVAVAGTDWVQWWLSSMTGVWGFPEVIGDAIAGAQSDPSQTFNDADEIANAANSVNFLGFAEGLLGVGSAAAYGVAGVCVMVTVAGLILAWVRPEIDIDLKVALLVCGMILIPPHVMFYDAGLLIVPMAILANRHGRAMVNRLCVIGALGLVAGFALRIGVSALLPAAVLLLWWIANDIRQISKPGQEADVVNGSPA
jgi:hypothetical protein